MNLIALNWIIEDAYQSNQSIPKVLSLINCTSMHKNHLVETFIEVFKLRLLVLSPTR